MASERDELYGRRKTRMEQQKRRKAAQRRMRIRLAIAAVVLLASAAVIYNLSRGETDAPIFIPNETQVEIYGQTEETTEETTEPKSNLSRAPTVIHLAAAGDLNVTDRVVWSGQSGTVYDYTNAFMDVAHIFSEADLALLNFEGNLYGQPYGTATMSAPQELMTALKNAGIDMVQMANSAAIYNGISGLQTTLSNIRTAGIEPVGAYSSNTEFNRNSGYTICEVQGLKLAFVAFTKGFGGLGLPAGSEDCVNLLYEDYYENYEKLNTDKINKVLKAVSGEKPDLVIALLHWGSEFNDAISDTQQRIANLMKKNGVDVIIGTHPHLVQEITYDESTGFLCAYSLGDFFGDGNRSGTAYSIILDLEITKNYDTGDTRVTNFDYTPIYTLQETDSPDNQRRVVRLETAMTAYSVNFVDKITESCNSNMDYSLNRIVKRVNGIE